MRAMLDPWRDSIFVAAILLGCLYRVCTDPDTLNRMRALAGETGLPHAIVGTVIILGFLLAISAIDTGSACMLGYLVATGLWPKGWLQGNSTLDDRRRPVPTNPDGSTLVQQKQIDNVPEVADTVQLILTFRSAATTTAGGALNKDGTSEEADASDATAVDPKVELGLRPGDWELLDDLYPSKTRTTEITTCRGHIRSSFDWARDSFDGPWAVLRTRLENYMKRGSEK